MFDISDVASEEFKKLPWSYSKRELLEQCPRKYYFNYYGANKKTAKKETRKEELHLLKGLTNRFLRSGEILHLAIRTYLKNYKDRSSYSYSGLIDWACDIYNKDIKFSSMTEDKRQRLKLEYTPAILMEYFYNLENAEKLCAELLKRLRVSLTTFFTNPNFIQFHQGVYSNDAIIEKTIRVKNSLFSASGKVDLSFKRNEKIVIIDWKLGGENNVHENLQLAFYGLWAVQEYKCQPENIELYKVCLSSNEIFQSTFTDRNLNRAKARIIQDIEKMMLLDKYGRNANYNPFPHRYPSQLCKLCQFQGICLKELAS
jgi:hypothetical protein